MIIVPILGTHVQLAYFKEPDRPKMSWKDSARDNLRQSSVFSSLSTHWTLIDRARCWVAKLRANQVLNAHHFKKEINERFKHRNKDK